MMNMRNGNVEFQFEEPELQEEYIKVSRYFDIGRRAAPVPFYPDPAGRLNGAAMIEHFQTEGLERSPKLSIYLHIPFCDGKCLFCDLYAFHVPLNKRDIVESYVRGLEEEIRLWARLFDLSKVDVTTVHFGGGSPLMLTQDQFKRLLEALNQTFSITPKTEIALEMTSSQITPENIRFLEEHHIFRIHVGVQTLRDEIRTIIGRREAAAQVMRKLGLFHGEPFVVSVDLLYGLPLQTPDILSGDIRRLINIGVDGFALYELNQSNAMRKMMASNPVYGVHRELSYAMFLKGKTILNQAGYRNVFFNHFGNRRDHNLYFTYPVRRENCLALGVIADGQIGPLFFRHLPLKHYLNEVHQGRLGIDFGYHENPARRRIRLFETEIMSGGISQKGIRQMNDAFGPAFRGMIDLWRAAGLIKENGDDFRLSGSGCWFVPNMIDQVRRL